MKRLPKSVKIGYLTFSIAPVPMPEEELGECDTRVRAIKVDETIKGAVLQDVLLHEIIHGIYAVYGILDDDGEERTATLLASALVTVFQDNPKVAAFLTEKAS